MAVTRGSQAARQCSFCCEPAVTLHRQLEQYLCSNHLVRHIQDSVIRTIEQNHLLTTGDRVAVALSGGKDSTALLLLLHQLRTRYPGVTLHAITIDEGIVGYREETIDAAKALARELGIGHSLIGFSDLFGDDLDTLLAGRAREACTVCGVLRRRALVIGARQVDATVIATGHNLDDEAQSVLMNVLRGDLPRLTLDTTTGSPGCFIPRIKPLSAISEKEIAIFLFVQGYFRDLPECPYAGHALRSEVRSVLSSLEYRYPGTMERLIKSRKDIRRISQSSGRTGRLQICQECGGPCSSELCQVCRLIRPSET